MARPFRFVVIYFAIKTILAAQHIYYRGLCDTEYCKCQETEHPSWISVNCKANGTDVYVGNADLPPKTLELDIVGCDTAVFAAGAFDKAEDLRRVTIDKCKTVQFLTQSSTNLNILNLSIEVQHCQRLQFDKKAFTNIIGPLSVTVNDCGSMAISGGTFSWLMDFQASNVRALSLGVGAFSLDTNASIRGSHGPGMSIELINTTISELSKSSFACSAARIYFEGLNIDVIRSGAFSANTYNEIDVVRSKIRIIEGDAFSANSLIHYLIVKESNINYISGNAIRSAVENLTINKTRFHHVKSGSVHTTVISVKIMNSIFHTFETKGFELSSWNLLQMENNTFDDLPPNAFVAPGSSQHKLIFKDNEIETVHAKSLSFVGRAAAYGVLEYKNNFYGVSCSCNKSNWLQDMLDTHNDAAYLSDSYCTVDEFLARCFHMLEGNVLYETFLTHVCHNRTTLACAATVLKDGEIIKFENTRFPHKVPTQDEGLSDRNKKVIGIIIISFVVCITIALSFSAWRLWRRHQGYGGCTAKTMPICSSTACGVFCRRLCPCGTTNGITNARSISQISVNEYSERHRLNESRAQDFVQESSFREEPIVPTEDKCCQTLPEELTKELLDKLKERLDNPENYVEAREMIEHLYELTKMTDATPTFLKGNNSGVEENIYELPYQDQARIGRNKKKMVSVGTRSPSLDKLLPLSPYYRQTALSHEYFEPKDLAVHLYAEIANSNKEKKTMIGSIPDVIAEQAIPRGPYLQSKLQSSSSSSSTPVKSKYGPRATSTMKSTSSDSSGKMINRPLPEKPSIEAGPGTSHRLG